MQQVVDQPTRPTNILDLIFVSDVSLVSNLSFEPPLSTSDHNTLVFSFYFGDLCSSRIDKPTTETIELNSNKSYIFEKADWLSFNDYLIAFD